VTRGAYGRRVREAKAFLDGLDQSPFDQLDAEMAAAAASFAYERAANLRDKILDLRWLQERLAWLQNARLEYSFVYPATNVDGQAIWYLIRGGRVLAATAAPDQARSRSRAQKALNAVFPVRGGPPLVSGECFDHVLLVAAWFRRYPDQKKLVFNVDRARSLCAPPSMSA
jgi:excinuclease ABC subunit C